MLLYESLIDNDQDSNYSMRVNKSLLEESLLSFPFQDSQSSGPQREARALSRQVML